jgi:hypothetical protein
LILAIEDPVDDEHSQVFHQVCQSRKDNRR